MLRWHLSMVSPKDKIMMGKYLCYSNSNQTDGSKRWFSNFVYYSFEYLILRIMAAW